MVGSSMKIVFVGNPAFSERIQALALRLADKGHEVTVLGTKRELPAGITNFQGVHLRRVSGVGGILLALWRISPQTLHLHGGSLVRRLPWLRRLLPDTTLVWTIDSLPTGAARKVSRLIRRAQKVCD